MVAKIVLGMVAAAGFALPAVLKVWTADLDPKGDSKVDGTARVETVGTDSIRATVNLTDAAAHATLTWGIHSGRCSAMGAMRGSQSVYPSISTDSTGAGSVSRVLALTLSGENSVAVHGSAAGSVIACGDLKPDKE